MKTNLKFAGSAAGLALLTGCVTYPYEDSFASCDRAAAQCYRGCEDSYGYGGYGDDRCRRDCDYSANRCFDSAYSPYRSSYGYDSYSSWPWRGSYGYWYPDRGYTFNFNYGSSRYKGRGYRDPYGYDRPGSRPGGYPPSRPSRPSGKPPGGGSPPPGGGYQPPPPPPGGGYQPPPGGGYQPPPGGGYQPPPGGGSPPPGGGYQGPPPSPPPSGGGQGGPPPPPPSFDPPPQPSYDPPRQSDPDPGPRQPNVRGEGGRKHED